jgi:RNA-directed DNA polymerase
MKYQEKAEAASQLSFFPRKKSEMTDAERVSMFTGKLYQKAKQDGQYRFYVLYDKMFLPYMLREAWKQVKRNNGSPGIDGLSVRQIEEQGIEGYLAELSEDLRKQTYKPRLMEASVRWEYRPFGIE